MSDALRKACEELGVVYRDVKADGRWHSTDVVTGKGGKSGKGDARIKLFADGLGGFVHNWQLNERLLFWLDDAKGAKLSPAEKAERERRRVKAAEEAEAKRLADAAKAAAKAREIMARAAEACAEHPYLERKCCRPAPTLLEIAVEDVAAILGYTPKSSGEELEGVLLAAPIHIGDEVSSVELIDEAGRKSAVAGGDKKAGYWSTAPLPNSSPDALFLCEGVATTLTIAEEAGGLAVAALHAGNLPRVAAFLRQRYPAVTLIIAADDDWRTVINGQSVNVGLKAAREAAEKFGALVIAPDFGTVERAVGDTDFNDLACRAGPGAVGRQIAEFMAGISEHEDDPWKPGGRATPLQDAPDPFADLDAKEDRSTMERDPQENAGAVDTENAQRSAMARGHKQKIANGSGTQPAMARDLGHCSPDSHIAPAPSDPMACATHFIEASFQHPEHPRLVRQGGQFYRWEGTCWCLLDDQDVRTEAYRFMQNAEYWVSKKDGDLERKGWNPTSRKIGDLLDALRAVAHIPSDTPSPSWLSLTFSSLRDIKKERVPPNATECPAAEMVACTNGLVHVPSRTLYPHTPLFYGHHAVPFAFDPATPPPSRWLGFLADLWGDDPESIDTLQEIFGYLIAGDTRQQKIFMIAGPKRSGKGTIGRILKALIGEHNIAGPTLVGLSTNFGLSPLIGKPVALISDARLGNVDTSIITERLLSISGEDTLTIDRKHRESLTLQFPTRIVILTNELPRLPDASGALASRIILLLTQKTFFNQENTGLTGDLLNELSSIFIWALDGFDRLSKRGHFVQPSSNQQVMQEMEDLGSPMAAFIRERCIVDARYETPCELLYLDWKDWCVSNGRKVTNVQMFGRDLRAVLPGIRMTQPREDGGRVRIYQGIGRKKAGDDDEVML